MPPRTSNQPENGDTKCTLISTCAWTAAKTVVVLSTWVSAMVVSSTQVVMTVAAMATARVPYTGFASR